MIRSALGFAAAAVVVIGGASMFSVDQTEQAIVTQFGQPVRVITQPGLNFKIPFIQQVISIERRILDLESASIEAITSDQKRLVVDAFARYRIENPLRYFQATGGVPLRGNQQLGTYMDAALRRVIGESTFLLVVKEDRGGLMGKIRDQVNSEAAALGVSIVDIRIRRADLPDQNSQAVFRRMQTERQREAAELRAQGVEISDRIKATADRTVTVTRADADRLAREALGRGEAERTRLLADAHNRNIEFFAFYRSLQAYETGLKSGDTRLVITPDSQFFRYLNNPSGKAPGQK
jgi:membrane protease subunit HflC